MYFFFLWIPVTVRKVHKYEVSSGRYIPVFGLNTGKNGPEKTPYLDIFHAVTTKSMKLFNLNCRVR